VARDPDGRAGGRRPSDEMRRAGGTLGRRTTTVPSEENRPVLLAVELTRHATGEIAIIGLILAALIGVLGGFLLTLDRRR
jgi:ABC-type dipeptide/oligopeptide/nickel transport system permease component